MYVYVYSDRVMRRWKLIGKKLAREAGRKIRIFHAQKARILGEVFTAA